MNTGADHKRVVKTVTIVGTIMTSMHISLLEHITTHRRATLTHLHTAIGTVGRTEMNAIGEITSTEIAIELMPQPQPF